MKSSLRPALVLLTSTVLFSAGCATRTTPSGGKETSLLGGALTVATNSFQPPAATTELVGQGNPSGAKTTLLWGLITLHDY